MELKNIFAQDLAGNAIPGAIARLYFVGTTTLVGIIKKTTDGTLQLKLAVSSGGSNASVAAGDAQYVLERIA